MDMTAISESDAMALQVTDVTKHYDSGFTLDDVTFDLPKGYIMGLIGPNGAGKSTLIKLILNMIHRDAGSIHVLGLDNIANEEPVKEQLGVVFDFSYMHEQWQVKNIERIVAPLYPSWDGGCYHKYLDTFGLGDAQNGKKHIKDLSRGMQMKLMLAIALSHDAKLLILDPMSSYIGDTCSMNNANETRAEFNHLIAVAKDTGCAIVIIAHMNKAKDTSPLYRTNGSIDIAGAARSILAVTRTANKQNPAERYLVQVKSNLAPMGSAILFEVADKGVNFLDELELSAEDAFSASAPRMGRPNAREEAATDFIRSLLAGGRQLASDCEAKLEAAGFKKSTYKKSKKKAGVRSVKDGFLWYWTLPEVEKPIENGQEVTDEDDLPI